MRLLSLNILLFIIDLFEWIELKNSYNFSFLLMNFSIDLIVFCLCYKLMTVTKGDPIADVFKRIIQSEMKSVSRETHIMWFKYIEKEIQIKWVEKNRRLNFKSCVEYLQYYSKNVYFQDIKVFHNKSRIVRKTIHFFRRLQLFGKIRTSARDAAMPSPQIDSKGKKL